MDNVHEYKGYKITIEQDDSAESPRNWDNLGTFAMFHNDYDFGDKHNFSIDDLKEYIQRDDIISLPVYMLDHSGITINTTGFSCPWDSGQIGYIFIDKQGVIKEYGDFSDLTIEKVKQVLKREIETLDNFVRGEVYGYTVEKPETCKCCGQSNNLILDSCWGFYDHEYCLSEAKSVVDNEVSDN